MDPPISDVPAQELSMNIRTLTVAGKNTKDSHALRVRRARVHAHRWMLTAGAVVTGASLGACNSLGSRQLPIDRFDYNTAIAGSANEQMLLNLVRLRHGEVPTFLAVNSVITQYVWTGETGVAGSSGDNLGFPAWSVGGFANARYIERPTVTYAPLSGQEFASQLISPVRADLVFSLVSSGWPPDQLLAMTIQRINDVENLGFAAIQGASHDNTGNFSRVIELIIELAKLDAIELVRAAKPEGEELYLDFSVIPNAPMQALVVELKNMIGLDQERSRFRVTRKIVGRGPDEITIRMHSLLELMGLLSVGVEAPAQEPPSSAPSVRSPGGDASMPLRVRCRRERPADSFVAVRYGDNWFDLAGSDEPSKRAFGLLIYLFQMQASQNPGAGPLITVPIG